MEFGCQVNIWQENLTENIRGDRINNILDEKQRGFKNGPGLTWIEHDFLPQRLKSELQTAPENTSHS